MSEVPLHVPFYVRFALLRFPPLPPRPPLSLFAPASRPRAFESCHQVQGYLTYKKTPAPL